ncbi:MAG: helix-turn-helix transcriptional regulator [Betaproteobacteria bacterium]|nr:helix-turn-helix transcriptional regulator [Betaproteobacteria bacterium]
MRPLLSTKEVADYLRLKERKVYDLVAQAAIPHSRVSGKLLFPRALVDEWVRQNTTDLALPSMRHAPAIIAGSSDPLLEWAVRESRSGLATMSYGSLDGVERLAAGSASAAALHLPAPSTRGTEQRADRNVEFARDRLAHLDCVLIEWARREQGLLLARGNPKRIHGLADLKRAKAPRVRVVERPTSAGSYLLFLKLLQEAGIAHEALQVVTPAAQTESDVAAMILDGRADAGLAVRAVAQQFQLDFLPLTTERLDLAVLRASYFDAPWQGLMAFARTPAFARYAKSLAGYDVRHLGEVKWNA